MCKEPLKYIQAPNGLAAVRYKVVVRWYSAFVVAVLFLTVPWVGLQSVIVAFPGHTHLLFVHE